MEQLTGGDPELWQKLDKFYQLDKIMNGKCEEEVLINRARRNWRLIRKKLKIVVMIGNLGLNTFNELRESKNKQQKEKEDIPEAEAPFSSRLIIP